MKYKLRKDLAKQVGGTTLFRIECVTGFGDTRAGELGGWIEKEENLSQEGNAWVYEDARVCGNAWVYGSARVYEDAKVCGSARVCGSSQIWLAKLSSSSLTFCCDRELGVSVTVGCQEAISLQEFRERIFEDGDYTEETLPKHRREYLKMIDLVEDFMEPHTEKEEK